MQKWMLAGIGVALLLGCESAEQKCANARGGALAEWTGYVQALEQERAGAVAAQRDARLKLTDDVDKRLLPLAQQRADARYPRSSEAWLRANKSAYHELCAADEVCRTQRERDLQAVDLQRDLDERLALARAARDAARGDVDGASRAATAAILHPEYPQLKQAQALVVELHERCQGLPVTEGQALSAVQR